MRRIGSILNALVALPIMGWLLVKSAVIRVWRYGLARIALVIMACWIALGCLAVTVTGPDPLNARWADAEFACREESPGSWPVTKPMIRLSGCVSWTYDEIVSSIGWDGAGVWILESYGTMVAGLTAGAINRQFLMQGLLLTLWIPVAVAYLPFVAVRYGIRWVA